MPAPPGQAQLVVPPDDVTGVSQETSSVEATGAPSAWERTTNRVPGAP